MRSEESEKWTGTQIRCIGIRRERSLEGERKVFEGAQPFASAALHSALQHTFHYYSFLSISYTKVSKKVAQVSLSAYIFVPIYKSLYIQELKFQFLTPIKFHQDAVDQEGEVFFGFVPCFWEKILKKS